MLDSFRNLEMEGFEVTYLPVDAQGLVSVESVKNAIRKDTIGVSIHYVHNEIGVIQDIPADEPEGRKPHFSNTFQVLTRATTSPPHLYANITGRHGLN